MAVAAWWLRCAQGLVLVVGLGLGFGHRLGYETGSGPGVAWGQAADEANLPAVGSPPETLRLSPFYTRYIEVAGYPIVASGQVNDYALREAAFLVRQMVGHRPEILQALAGSGSRMCVIAHSEFTTDLPDFARLGPVPGFESLTAKDYWDARARGTGGSATDPCCSCGEENLLGYAGDPYAKECLLLHEFAHTIHLRALNKLDPTFDRRLRETWRAALDKGLWKGKYASVNSAEYFAEGAQSWFDDNRENDHDHNHVNTREELREYDPGLASLCEEVFGDREWRYTKAATRLQDHLAGYDPARAPQFAWPERLAAAQKAIRAQAIARSEGTQKPQAEEPPKKPEAEPAGSPWLSLERLYEKGEFGEQGARTPFWSERSAAYFTWEKPTEPNATGQDLVRRDCATDAAEVIAPASLFLTGEGSNSLAGSPFRFSANERRLLLFTNTRRVWRENTRGDYWVLDLDSRKLRRLGGDAAPASLMFARFSPDGGRIAYVRDNNIYVENVETGVITPLTTDGSARIINGTADWVNEEELEIRDAFRFSPDGRSIAYWQFHLDGVREMSLIDNTQGNYPRVITIPYPKVGEQNSATRVGIVPVAGGETRWIDLPGDPRNHYIPRMEWTPNSTGLLIQQMNRVQNTNTVYLASFETARSRVVLVERDDAWIENDNPIRWLDQGRQFLWLSERSGWRHLYRASLDGTLTPITQGDWDVMQVEALDQEGGWVYFAASPDNATQRYLYRARLDGTQTERITPADSPGWNTYRIAPQVQYATHGVSQFLTPAAFNFIKLPSHEVVRPLADNARLRQKLATLRLPGTRFVKLPIADGVELDGWLMTPPEFDPTKKYPLLVHVYGEPHGQTVRDAWLGNTGLWHAMLAQRGCFVASFDNRGVILPKGRAWRKSVHHKIGQLGPADQAAALKELCRQIPQIDPQRVGIWGWSGGGSSSLNAILQYPDLYQTAVAVAAVPNQKLYDTIYQERYMGLPEENAEGYRLGSPLTHAANLKGNLLIVHGTGDDNVHYQGVEQLMDALIAHHRHFAVLPYANRSHGISEGANTSRHLFTTMTRYLGQHLLQAPANSQFAELAPPDLPVPAGYSLRIVQGWKLFIDDRLARDQPEPLRKAVQILDDQLREVERLVPAKAVETLRRVNLWFSPAYEGVGARAEYHPGEAWLRDNGRNPLMVKGVEFTDIPIFEQELKRMPNFVLHELAHAYHDQVLGFDHPRVQSLFEQAKSGGKYEKVLVQDAEGNRREARSYALTNPMEYFAELSESYFGRNDFFPFDQAELRDHDPDMHTLLGELWGVTPSAAAVRK